MSEGIASALVGLVGVVLGVVLSELIRRRQRPENLASQIFAKRFEIYAMLWVTISNAGVEIDKMISNHHLSKEERHEIVSEQVLGIANFCDESAFYISDDITVHCVTLFMGSEDFHYSDPLKLKAEIDALAKARRETRQMLMEDGGIVLVNKALKTVSGARPDSPVIRYFQEQGAKQDRL